MSDQEHRTIQISTRTILTTVFILLGLYLLFQVRDIILLLLVAATLASALEPLVAWANRRLRFPRAITVLLVYIVVIGVIAGLVYLLTPAFVQQFRQLGDKFNDLIQGNSGSLGSFLQKVGLNKPWDQLLSGFTGNSIDTFKKTIGIFTGALEVIAILVISFYLVVEQQAAKNSIRNWIPEKHRERALRVIETIQRKLGMWLLGQLIISVTLFGLTFLALSIIKVPLALALAALVGILEIVPFLGPIISAIPAILIAFTISPTMAVIVAALFILVHKLEGYILVPKIMEKTVGVHPLIILVSVLVGFKLAGIVGALLAVPIVTAGSVLIDAYVVGRMPKVPSPEEISLK